MNDKTKKILIILAIALAVGSCIFMLIISPLRVKTGNREMPEADGQTSEITNGIVIEQKFVNITKDINEITIVFNRAYYLDDDCNVTIELLNGNSELIKKTMAADSIDGNHRTYLYPESPLSDLVGKELTLKIYSDTTAGTGLSLMINSSEDSTYKFGNSTEKGTICFSVTGK